MTEARVIPCLLVDGDALVKTTAFADPVYIGDPVNVLSIFSSFAVDEIMLLDIRATLENRAPRLEMLAHLADECMIPLGYGGGITSIDQVQRIIEIGLEKVVITTAAVENPGLIRQCAAMLGSQAVVGGIDVRRFDGRPVVVTRSAMTSTELDPVEHAKALEDLGAGEILLTAVDREGTMSGYDLELVAAITSAVSVPVIAHGGAGRRAELSDPVRLAGASAVAAGSLFVYQGRQRGVLINYPSRAQLVRLFDS